jgi:hypothetical protein
MLFVAALLPACLAVAHVGNVADAAHDGAVTRAMGLQAQPWRSLDVGVASVFAVLPLGTRAARAALGEVMVIAAAGAVLYLLARRIAAACADAPRFGSLTAAIATFAALCAPVWQMEGAAVGGSATGALLVLLPIATLARPSADGAPPPWRGCVLLLGLAMGHEPLVGACALAGCAAFAGVGTDARRSLLAAWKGDRRSLALCFLAGLAPLGLALVRTRAAGVPLGPALADALAGERGASHAGSPAPLLRAELGVVLGAMALAGTVLAARVPRARALGAALLAVDVVGFA